MSGCLLPHPIVNIESSSAWQKRCKPHTRHELVRTIHSSLYSTWAAAVQFGDRPPSPGKEHSDPCYQRFLTEDCILKVHHTDLFFTWGSE